MADEPITADTLLQVPRWLQTHPELLRRGIVLTDCLKPVSGLILSYLFGWILTQKRQVICLQHYLDGTTRLRCQDLGFRQRRGGNM